MTMNAIAAAAGAVLNSLWQSLVLALLVWVALRTVPARVNAATRHAIWWITLAVIVLLPCVPRSGRSAPAAAEVPSAQPVPPGAPLWPVPVAAPLSPPAAEGAVEIVRKRAAVWPLWALAVWAAFFVREAVVVLLSFFQLRGVKRRARVWAQRFPNTGRPARLLVSSEISSPIAAGFLHPAVVVPENLRERLTSAEMDCVLLHEAAHLARHDDWTNLIAQVVRAPTALHPAARWILRQIEREREMACDDWVVAHTGRAYSYAESLARVVELSAARDVPVLAAGVFTRRSRLRARIEALLQRGREFSPLTARRSVGTAAAALVLLAAAGALAPHWIVFAQRLEFEVASVKHTSNVGPFGSDPRRSGDRFTMHNAQLYTIIWYAYHLRGNYQLVGDLGYGVDEWNSFDIDARVGHDATDDQVRLMVQSLLADRFDLKLHRETRELPEYVVTIAKGGPKLTPASEQPMEVRIEGRHFSLPKSTCMGSAWREGNHITCHAATIEQILAQTGGELKAPVADRTGLTGTYDVDVLYMPDFRRMQADTEPEAAIGPSLPEAFQEQLGLKVEKGKGPVEVIVVDHFEKKPREN